MAALWLGLMGGLAAALGATIAAQATDDPPELGLLSARAVSEGSVRVIVGFPEPGVPGWARAFPADSEIARWARRIEIADEQDRLLSNLAPARNPRRDRSRSLRRFREVPALALSVSAAELAYLAASDQVVSLEEDRLHAATLGQTVPLIEARLARVAGFDGSGQSVAVLDTGVDAQHPFLEGRVLAEACFSANGNCPNGSTSQVGPGAARPCDYATTCYHGTHVAGIVAGGGGFFPGVAPASQLVAVQVFSEFTGSICGDAAVPCALAYTSDIVAGLDHVAVLAADFDVAAANLSLGSGHFTSQSACDAANPSAKASIDALRNLGIATLAASGNEGYLEGIGAPACISSAFSVGATDDADNVADFSNSAAFLSLLAPGVSVVSSVPPALLGFSYGVASGTSMATPHVAAAFALARQAVPDTSVDEIFDALRATGVPITDENGVTTSRIRVMAAIESLQPLAPAAPDSLARGCAPGDDPDGDGVCVAADNCSELANPRQIDSDQDGYGNACDADYDNDAVVTGADFASFRAQLALSSDSPQFNPDVDSDGDGEIGGTDFAILRMALGGPPGPSGLSCAGTIPCLVP